MQNNEKINLSTPLACLTFGQFIEAFRTIQEEPKSPKVELPRYFTPPGLSNFTGLKLSTIYIKNSHKEIPGAKKIGGKLLFDTVAILEWIESGSVRTKTESGKLLEANFQKGRK